MFSLVTTKPRYYKIISLIGLNKIISHFIIDNVSYIKVDENFLPNLLKLVFSTNDQGDRIFTFILGIQILSIFNGA